MDMAKILVVDDEPEIISFIKSLLERDGHQVVTAGDGKTAKQVFLEGSFDLLITDIVLPEKEGLDLILELERELPSMRSIAISGGDRIEAEYYLELATLLGARHTLAKPFTPQEMLQKVRDVLNGQGPIPASGHKDLSVP